MKERFGKLTKNELLFHLKDIKEALFLWRDYDNSYTQKLNKELDVVRELLKIN